MDNSIHKAAFLGPKGENADELERLLLEVLRDHVFWRRNFHPSDPRLIDERDKQSEHFGQMTADLRDELFQILAELKRAAPHYSPRQIAHMVSDPTLPALVGYFAGMLYNQNNVVAEASPETVREEREYLNALARMVGYPPFLPEMLSPGTREARTSHSWGHLCSGGTVANLEALWVARNVRLYPLAVRLLTATAPQFEHYNQMPVTLATGERRPLEALSTFELSNLPIDEITDLHLRIKRDLSAAPGQAAAFQDALPSVRQSGLAAFLLSYNDTFPDDPCGLPKVFISQAAHYCWKKNMDIIGLGADALESVPVDDHIRLDVEALAERVETCAKDHQPVLAVISICGTTEEGAIDPLHEIEAFRRDVADRGITFWHHADAAFGGYFASMLPHNEDGTFVPVDDLDESNSLVGPEGLITEEVYRGIAAISETDSVTVDPHKFGYIPYPAGAVLFRDYHVRDAISYAAPYLSDDDAAGFGGFLGQWTLEGSRPGAAAVSCYLSQAAVPLTANGHGHIMKNCIAANRALVEALRARFSEDQAWMTLRPFAEPDTVGFCFALMPRSGIGSVEQLNTFTERIWRRMTVDGREDINQYDFLLSKTEVDVATYQHILADTLEASLVDAAARDDASLVLLRSCLMNPFLEEWNAAEPSFARRFADYLHEVALEEYLDHVLPPLTQANGQRPLRILVVENAPRHSQALTRRLQFEDYAAHLDVRGHPPGAVLGGNAPVQKAQKIVLKVDPMDPNRTLEVTTHLIDKEGIAPEQIIVLTRDDRHDALNADLQARGLPAVNILPERSAQERLKGLMIRLYTPLDHTLATS